MADKKISQLSNITGANLADNDEFVVVDVSADETKAITYGELKKFNGDISFYEDTGTTPKFYWDASAESLGIGTTSPAHPLDVTGTIRSDVSTTGDFNFYATSGGGGAFRIYPDDATTANPTWQYQSNSSEDQAWVIGGVERMRIDSSGHAIIPAGVTLGTAAGVYNADKTLDDYEEGTWTPVISDGTNNGTSDVAVGTYVKTGNHVHVQGRVRLSSLGSVSGSVRLKGLPFNSKLLSNNFGVMVVGRAAGLNVPVGQAVYGDLRANVDYVNLIVNDVTAGTSNLQDTEFTDDGDISFSMDYISN